jgi:hypothetical protein
MQFNISNQQPGNLVSFDAWLTSLAKTRTTGFRWRKQYPWLKTVNIFGKLYISRDTIAEFERRAIAGELSKEIKPDQAGGNER